MANNHIADDRKKVRLIDANYFVNKGIRNCPIEEGGIPLGDFAKHQKILELYPTVDAVEVVHGRWEEVTDQDEIVGEMDFYKCSVCGKLRWFETNYCPNCGAKMDGDGNS